MGVLISARNETVRKRKPYGVKRYGIEKHKRRRSKPTRTHSFKTMETKTNRKRKHIELRMNIREKGGEKIVYVCSVESPIGLKTSSRISYDGFTFDCIARLLAYKLLKQERKQSHERIFEYIKYVPARLALDAALQETKAVINDATLEQILYNCCYLKLEQSIDFDPYFFEWLLDKRGCPLIYCATRRDCTRPIFKCGVRMSQRACLEENHTLPNLLGRVWGRVRDDYFNKQAGPLRSSCG